ncbi:MAG: hypothetical protein ABL959_25455 [Pyrinomonadaceae bacterium]
MTDDRLSNMGADSVTIFYGIRFQIEDKAEIDKLLIAKHPLVRAGKKVGLNHYWGNFSRDGGEYYLLYIGTEIGTFGHEGSSDIEISDDRFARIQRDTRKKIAKAGFSLVPSFFAQFEPDT